MDNVSIIIYSACFILLFLLGRIFIIPLKKIIKLLLNSILGGALIYAINFIGEGVGFHIGLNVFTAIFVGILGIPRKYIFNYDKNYSTVTDFARFLGLSTSKFLPLATKYDNS